ncbi:hypothetical protein BDK51DRAFT_46701, partial [Blyttiomyces helicus]
MFAVPKDGPPPPTRDRCDQRPPQAHSPPPPPNVCRPSNLLCCCRLESSGSSLQSRAICVRYGGLLSQPLDQLTAAPKRSIQADGKIWPLFSKVHYLLSTIISGVLTGGKEEMASWPFRGDNMRIFEKTIQGQIGPWVPTPKTIEAEDLPAFLESGRRAASGEKLGHRRLTAARAPAGATMNEGYQEMDQVELAERGGAPAHSRLGHGVKNIVGAVGSGATKGVKAVGSVLNDFKEFLDRGNVVDLA